jgi:WD40 repeat protein
MRTHYCISCGEPFETADPKMVLCPACGGEPGGTTPEAPDVTQAASSPLAPLPGGEESQAVFAWQEGDVILDTYEVKHIFDQGAMGLVYRVHHRGWNIDLAMKSPRAEIIAKYGEEDFIREANAWVELGLHPHIVSCYYVRKIDELPRVFAEFVEGGSLKDWIEDQHLYEGGKAQALERILDVAIQFAWGLVYAHERGLVHQDVKPANVLMMPEGIAKVSDFGLAKARAVEGEGIGASQDRRGGLVPVSANLPGGSIQVSFGGMTPAYCSPEQARREAVSRKTDIWSWGLSVLEMFVGEVTWYSGQAAGEVLEGYLEMGAEGEAIPPMPPELVALLRQCFRQNPEDRPADMLEIAGRLQAIYQEETGQAYPREMPKAAELRADGLNNKALSLLDLGQPEKARAAWEEALKLEPHHLEAIYNLGLIHWRSAQITDEALLERLREAGSSHPGDWMPAYLQALVHLERGDRMSAGEALKSLQEQDAERQEVQAASMLADSPNANPYRLVRTFEGHEDGVSSVCLSADGRFALSGSGGDHTLKLWEVESGHCLRTFEGHKSVVISVCLSANGRHALSGSGDNTLKLWEVASGHCLRTFDGHTRCVNSVCLSADGRYALSGSTDKTLKLWEVASNSCLRTFEGHKHSVLSVCLSADGRYALSGSLDKTLKLWEVASGRCLRTFEGHEDGVSSVCLSADGRYALSGSRDKTLKLWEVETGRCLRTFEGHTSRVESVCLSADGRHALSGGVDSTLRLWDVASGSCLRTFEGHTDRVTSVCLSADGRYALSGSRDNTLKLWEIDRVVTAPAASFMLSQVQQVQEALTRQQAFDRSLLQAQQLLAQGNSVEAARQVRQARAQPGFLLDPQALQLWQQLYMRLPHAAFRQGWKLQEFLGHQAGVNSVCLSADGRYALSGSSDKTLKLWEVETGRCLRTFEGHKYGVSSVCLSADGRYALSGISYSMNNTLRLWEVATGRGLRIIEGHNDGVESVCLSTDGRYALSGSLDKTLKLWEVASGRCLRTFEGHTKVVTSVCLSPDVRYALSGSWDQTLKLWEVETGRCLRTFEGHTDDVNSVCLSANGRHALSGSRDKTLKLWEVESGRCLRTFEGHTSHVNSVCLGSDGRYALWGGGDQWKGELILWEVATGRCLRTFEGHTKEVNSVYLSADGRYALSGSDDKTIILWALDWELEDKEPTDWNKGARPYLETFLTLHTPYARKIPADRVPTKHEIRLALTRRGAPTWTEEDFQHLLYTLGCAGYGWLKPEGVRRELERMAKERG